MNTKILQAIVTDSSRVQAWAEYCSNQATKLAIRFSHFMDSLAGELSTAEYIEAYPNDYQLNFATEAGFIRSDDLYADLRAWMDSEGDELDNLIINIYPLDATYETSRTVSVVASEFMSDLQASIDALTLESYAAEAQSLKGSVSDRMAYFNSKADAIPRTNEDTNSVRTFLTDKLLRMSDDAEYLQSEITDLGLGSSSMNEEALITNSYAQFTGVNPIFGYITQVGGVLTTLFINQYQIAFKVTEAIVSAAYRVITKAINAVITFLTNPFDLIVSEGGDGTFQNFSCIKDLDVSYQVGTSKEYIKYDTIFGTILQVHRDDDYKTIFKPKALSPQAVSKIKNIVMADSPTVYSQVSFDTDPVSGAHIGYKWSDLSSVNLLTTRSFVSSMLELKSYGQDLYCNKDNTEDEFFSGFFMSHQIFKLLAVLASSSPSSDTEIISVSGSYLPWILKDNEAITNKNFFQQAVNCIEYNLGQGRFVTPQQDLMNTFCSWIQLNDVTQTFDFIPYTTDPINDSQASYGIKSDAVNQAEYNAWMNTIILSAVAIASVVAIKRSIVIGKTRLAADANYSSLIYGKAISEGTVTPAIQKKAVSTARLNSLFNGGGSAVITTAVSYSDIKKLERLIH